MKLSITKPGPALSAAAAICLGLISAPAMTQAPDKYPSRPLTIYIPFGAGSSSDIGVRQMAGKMQPKFGQPIIVEARPGAQATIAPAVLLRAKPDGYSIMYGTTSSLATAPSMVKNLTYDPVKDFSGITLVAEQYFVLLTRNEYKGMSFPQFLERMRKEPEKFPVGGQSGAYETLNNMIRESAKLTHTFVPYKEVGQMMSDLWGGRLGSAIVVLNLGLPAMKGGQGHIVALSSRERSPAIPDTPLMQETLPGVQINAWTGYFAQAKTPRPIITTLHAMITEVGKDPEVNKRNAEGGRALFTTPEETDAYVRKEVPRWTALMKAAGIQPE